MCCVMSTIRYLCFPLMAIGFSVPGPAIGAEPSLSEAVRAADAKYLEAPEIGTVDKSPKIVAGGGEDGLPPLDAEVSQGRVRVTLTYVEEEPQPEKKPIADELPGDADEAPAVGVPEAEDPAAADAIPLEDIPEEATLPGEFDVGETVWRAPIVTIYFDDPNPLPVVPEEPQAAEEPFSDLDEAAAEAATPPVPAGPRVVAKLHGPSSGVSDPPVSIQIAELDPNNPYPEVVVSFFTGGAHCCSVTQVVTSNADGSAWSTIPVGEFDGGPLLAIDLDGDGTYEFETRDNSFLYAFACYACSEAPLQVLALEGDKIEDVSAAPRFRPAHAAWLKTMIVGVPEQEVNGFLAGYVGEKIRLGEGKQAWALMRRYYDRNTDWGLDICDTERDENAECPGETKQVSFPQALELMLKKNGYKIGG